MERESNGDGNRREEAVDEVVEEVEVEVEGEGDMYLDGTCLPLGFRVRSPLSFSEGNNGGLA